MKMVPTPCINIVLWVRFDECLSVAWGHVKGGFARADMGERDRAVVGTNSTGYVKYFKYNSKFNFFLNRKCTILHSV